jgi:hypothetical protein
MIGAAFILSDPIFQGLAISLVFGLASSTALTVLVIPAIYVVLRDDGRGFEPKVAAPRIVAISIESSRAAGSSVRPGATLK